MATSAASPNAPWSVTAGMKCWRSSAWSTVALVAVTVAVRGTSLRRAISPTKSPGPSAATRRPSFVTSTVPLSIT